MYESALNTGLLLQQNYGKTWTVSTVGNKKYYNNLLTKQSYDVGTKKKVSFSDIVSSVNSLGLTAAEIIRALNTAQTPEQIQGFDAASLANLTQLQNQQQTQTQTWYWIGGGFVLAVIVGLLIYFKK
jgi:hypothetical protein